MPTKPKKPHYKSALQLGITAVLRRGLIQTLADMRAGRLDKRIHGRHYFDMSVIHGRRTECGTSLCIAGYLMDELHIPARQVMLHHSPVGDRLFAIDVAKNCSYCGEWSDITIGEGIAAIDAFLRGVRYPWRKVLARDPVHHADLRASGIEIPVT